MSSSFTTVPAGIAAPACLVPMLKVHVLGKNYITPFFQAQGFVCPGRGRQDAELSAKVGQLGDDDSLQGQRRRAWTP